MRLGELITTLESANQHMIVPVGFANPHSYRGWYEELAFEPAENVTVASMLTAAREALGTTYEGYKGGDFKMDEYSKVNLAWEGRTGETIGPIFLSYMLGNPMMPEENHRL